MGENDMEKIFMNPSVEHLVARYLDLRNAVHILKKRGGIDPDIIASCETQLSHVDALLKNPFRRKVTLVWQLLHRVGEELILVMDEAELAAEGHKLLEDLKIAPVPDTLKNHWIEILHGKVTDLEKHLAASGRAEDASAAKAGEQEGQQSAGAGRERARGQEAHPHSVNLAATRQLFKTAAYTVNECVDDRFWDISVRKAFAFVYGSLLLLTGLFFLFKTWHYDCGLFCLSISNIMLVGAIGGLVSGLITSDQEYLSKGHFWIPTIYYSLVRPTVGAVAAVVVFWMVEGHYLIQVTPPLGNCCLSFACADAGAEAQAGGKGNCPDPGEIRKQQRDAPLPGAAEAAGRKSGKSFSQSSSSSVTKKNGKAREGKKPLATAAKAAPAKKDASFKNSTGARAGEGGKGDGSLITLRTEEGRQIYLYLLILFFAGFSGDKILKSVSCKLNARLFADAEKTKEAKK